MIPLRCFTCGKLVGRYWEEYQRRVSSGETPKSVLDSLGLNRYCCRRMLLTSIDALSHLIRF